MRKMTELKPCPFCGNRPEIFVDNALFSLFQEDEENTNFKVSCHCGIHTKFHQTRKEAIETWNRRVGDGLTTMDGE